MNWGHDRIFIIVEEKKAIAPLGCTSTFNNKLGRGKAERHQEGGNLVGRR